MAKQLLNFKGLYGEHFEPFERSSIHYEPLRKRTQLYDNEITEHLHTDLVQLFVIREGEGLLLSAGQKINLEPPCVLIIPVNTLHGFAFQSEARGEVFTILESLFEKLLKNAPVLFSPFEQLQHFTFDTTTTAYQDILDIKEKIIAELHQKDRSTELALTLLLQLLMIHLCRSKQENQVTLPDTDNRSLQHFQTFKKLLKQQVHLEKSVQFYAGEMQLTTVHLNRICKTVSQKTALQIIHEYLLKEAKKYLRGSSYSITEIAYFLGFNDPAHFSRFFRKQEGCAPGVFRNSS